MSDENYPPVHRHHFDMVGARPLYSAEVLSPVIDALCAGLAPPEGWRMVEGRFDPYDRDEVIEHACGDEPSEYLLELRNRRRNYECSVDLRYPEVMIQSLSKTPRLAEGFSKASDALVQVYCPDICWVQTLWDVEAPFRTPTEKRLERLSMSADGHHGTGYGEYGPLGLGMRTYFGPRLIELIGADRLLSTPEVSIQEQDWGGMRVDLTEQPWKAEPGALCDAWDIAMDHLKPSGVFAEVDLGDNGGSTMLRAPRFNLRY